MSRSATHWMELVSACSISTRSSNHNLIQTTGPVAPLLRTRLVAGAQWVLTRLWTMPRASGTATQWAPTPSFPLERIEITAFGNLYPHPHHILTLISEIANHHHLSGDGHYDQMHKKRSFCLQSISATRFLEPHSIEHGVARKRCIRTAPPFSAGPLAHMRGLLNHF